ncbi:MAG: metallophosphoesterase [Methylococcales bacterium]|jgi:hypothetical protein|nr:metallophosphoesterase [Methylococcales bacterium]
MKTRYYAIFGDIHGRISLMYTLAKLWEHNSNCQLEALLQVGDFGAFPDIQKLDKATLKYAKKDSDELGFSKFALKTAESTRYFSEDNLPKTYFCRGNHEDFDYLSSFQTTSPIDPWHNIWFIPDGIDITLPGVDQDIVVGSFGGIEAPCEEGNVSRQQKKSYRRKSEQVDPKYFNQKLLSQAFFNHQIDILLTHAGPHCDAFIHGSKQLKLLAERLHPKVHAFGHHHVVLEPCIGPGDSLLIGLEHLTFTKQGNLKPGSWGVLKHSTDGYSFTMGNLEEMPWLAQITQSCYRHFWPVK